MRRLAQRQQYHIEDLTKLLRQHTARLDETERELARQKEKRSSDKSEIKLLRREVQDQQCPSCKRTKPHRSREAITPVRKASYQPREKQVGYVEGGLYSRGTYSSQSKVRRALFTPTRKQRQKQRSSTRQQLFFPPIFYGSTR